jgi:hypothetical protein
MDEHDTIKCFTPCLRELHIHKLQASKQYGLRLNFSVMYVRGHWANSSMQNCTAVPDNAYVPNMTFFKSFRNICPVKGNKFPTIFDPALCDFLSIRPACMQGLSS